MQRYIFLLIGLIIASIIGMKHENSENQCCPHHTHETISELELAMTNSAIGFEYAKLALENIEKLGMQADRLSIEIEQHKIDYFEARDKLKTIDTERLSILESNLKNQKMVMFHPQQYLH